MTKRLPVPGSLGEFPLSRNFYVRRRVYKIDTIYGRSRVDVKVEPRSVEGNHVFGDPFPNTRQATKVARGTTDILFLTLRR